MKQLFILMLFFTSVSFSQPNSQPNQDFCRVIFKIDDSFDSQQENRFHITSNRQTISVYFGYQNSKCARILGVSDFSPGASWISDSYRRRRDYIEITISENTTMSNRSTIVSVRLAKRNNEYLETSFVLNLIFLRSNF